MKMFKYYEVTAKCGEVLYSSYDRIEATYELDAMRDQWKDEGYKGIKLRWIATEVKPDPAIYGKAFKPNTTEVKTVVNMPDFTNKALAQFIASL